MIWFIGFAGIAFIAAIGYVFGYHDGERHAFRAIEKTLEKIDMMGALIAEMEDDDDDE